MLPAAHCEISRFTVFMFGERIRPLISKGRALGIRSRIFLIYIYIWTVMSHCLNGHETIGTSLLPKWRPYWKSLMGRGRKSVYRLGKSKSLICVFILIRSRLPSHPHPPTPALMRRLCPLFLMFFWKLQFGKTYEIIEPCNTSESCQLIFVGQGANEAKRVAKRDSLTCSSVMLSHLGSRLSVVQVLCMLALYT